jgi:GTPase SAR1 family protein
LKRSRATAEDIRTIRESLAAIVPGAAHQASTPPEPQSIFATPSHVNALDPYRVLVVGNRGVGKSFWSSVLTHESTRRAVAADYPKLSLERIEGVLGFHEDAGKDDGPAPSPAVLRQLLNRGHEPEDIWRAVLIKSLKQHISVDLPESISEIIAWDAENIERREKLLRDLDRHFQQNGRTFLLVFDALDRLGKDWAAITPLTKGLLRFALDVRGYRSIKTKIFMRTDQSNDDSLFRFTDASKIRADAVKLIWHREELFGLMYKTLLEKSSSKAALIALAGASDSDRFEDDLLSDPKVQEDLFYRIAGEFMGAGAKRGRTFTWIYDHLADAFGETSPRSFLTALRRAASNRPVPKDTAIDHYGIRAGVQDASEVRVRQLKEDYDWINHVLKALEGLEVPCDPDSFKSRWRERKTVATIVAESEATASLLPLELENNRSKPEEALLQALNNIGVVEFRTEERINVPDIFRVEAGIKRRGGVRPPTVRRS